MQKYKNKRLSFSVALTLILLIFSHQAAVKAQREFEPEIPATRKFFTYSEDDIARQGWRLHTILPADTDPNITTGDPNANNLVVFNPNETRPANLLLYLGSSRRWNGNSGKAFMWTALEAGYRVIVLDYKYNPPGTSYCTNSKDGSCWYKFHEKKIFGDITVPQINEPPASCIVNRTIKLLQYLSSNYPDENWQQYLIGNKPYWNRIAVTGFSQSTSHAAFLAKRVPLARVILSPGPPDHFERPPKLAGWLSNPSATPSDRWYAMYHEKENYAPWLVRIYPVLGVPRNHVRVCTFEPSHPGDPNEQYHWTTQEYSYAPRDKNGNFLFQDAWTFVLGSGIRE